MTESWTPWPESEPTGPLPPHSSRTPSARWAVLAGGGLLAAGVVLQTVVLWFLAGYLGPTGSFAYRLSIFYGGLGGSYALQGVGILIGAVGWAAREPRERPSRGHRPDPRVASRWRVGRALAVAGGVVAASAQLFNAVSLLLASPYVASQRFVLLTPEVQIVPSLLLGLGIVLFVSGWALRKTPEPFEANQAA
jgi:hypothetical protein